MYFLHLVFSMVDDSRPLVPSDCCGGCIGAIVWLGKLGLDKDGSVFTPSFLATLTISYAI